MDNKTQLLNRIKECIEKLEKEHQQYVEYCKQNNIVVQEMEIE